MCIIIWTPTGRIPKDQVINAMLANQDGWGFSVAKNGTTNTFRSTNFRTFLDAWMDRPKGPTVFHARYATHGRVCHANCHPFRVAKHNMVVAHNGVLHGYGSARKSDTRDFIEKVIAPMPVGFQRNNKALDTLEEMIGNSKLVLLDGGGNETILNERLGFWHGHLWYSNRSAW
jgi:glutamine amidotransferase